MRDDILLEGTVPADGIVELLAEIESTRATGVLRFESALEGTGEVLLVCGQFALEQKPDRRGRDPIEVLLELREGRFVVLQRLPTLPVSNGDGTKRSGSLAVHVPAELMRYCERAGLTGTLRMTHPPRQVELHYERGDLAEIRVSDRSHGAPDHVGDDPNAPADASIEEVFGWDDGHFSITARRIRAAAPIRIGPATETGLDAVPELEEPPERRDRTTDPHGDESAAAHFLRVVEVPLDDLIREREAPTRPKRTGPIIPELPAVRTKEPPPRLGESTGLNERADSSIRILYYLAEDDADDTEQQETERPPGRTERVPHPERASGAERESRAIDPERSTVSALWDAGGTHEPTRAPREREQENDATMQFDTGAVAQRDLKLAAAQFAKTQGAGNDAPIGAEDPGRTPLMSESSPTTPAPTHPASGATESSPLVTAGWVAFALLTLLACLTVLAQLPPID